MPCPPIYIPLRMSDQEAKHLLGLHPTARLSQRERARAGQIKIEKLGVGKETRTRK